MQAHYTGVAATLLNVDDSKMSERTAAHPVDQLAATRSSARKRCTRTLVAGLRPHLTADRSYTGEWRVLAIQTNPRPAHRPKKKGKNSCHTKATISRSARSISSRGTLFTHPPLRFPLPYTQLAPGSADQAIQASQPSQRVSEQYLHSPATAFALPAAVYTLDSSKEHLYKRHHVRLPASLLPVRSHARHQQLLRPLPTHPVRRVHLRCLMLLAIPSLRTSFTRTSSIFGSLIPKKPPHGAPHTGPVVSRKIPARQNDLSLTGHHLVATLIS